MLDRRRRTIPTHHPSKFRDALFAGQGYDRTRRDAPVIGLADDKMSVGVCRDLGQVRDDDDLGARGEGGQ